jgi:hypothetical protein
MAILVKKGPIFPCFAQKRKKLHSSQLRYGGTIVTHCEYMCYRPHSIGFGSLDATMDGVNIRMAVYGSRCGGLIRRATESQKWGRQN